MSFHLEYSQVRNCVKYSNVVETFIGRLRLNIRRKKLFWIIWVWNEWGEWMGMGLMGWAEREMERDYLWYQIVLFVLSLFPSWHIGRHRFQCASHIVVPWWLHSFSKRQARIMYYKWTEVTENSSSDASTDRTIQCTRWFNRNDSIQIVRFTKCICYVAYVCLCANEWVWKWNENGIYR